MKNKIKILGFMVFTICIAFLFVQCEDDTLPQTDGNKDTGFLKIYPGIDISRHKAAQDVPADSFKVEIYDISDVLVFEVENFIDLSFPIELPVGSYYVLIHSNNLVPAAFDNPYYEGTSAVFNILKGQTTSVDVIAELANVKLTVQYSAQTQADFTGFLTVVSTGTDSLAYVDQDTSAGYFIVTPLFVRAQLAYPADGGGTDTLVILGEIPNPQPKDHIVLTIQAALGAGGINLITFTIDESTNPVNITIGDTTVSTGPGILVDPRDGQEYSTVQIGSQVWMAENLAFLPGSLSPPSTGSEVSPHYYEGDPTMGILYNWTAAMNNTFSVGTQGVCPSGWHLPSNSEWQQLVDFVQSDSPGTGVALALKATSGWSSGNGTDNYGFAALPAGRRFTSGGIGELGANAYFWTSNESGGSFAFMRQISTSGSDVFSSTLNKSSGISVRCVQD